MAVEIRKATLFSKETVKIHGRYEQSHITIHGKLVDNEEGENIYRFTKKNTYRPQGGWTNLTGAEEMPISLAKQYLTKELAILTLSVGEEEKLELIKNCDRSPKLTASPDRPIYNQTTENCL